MPTPGETGETPLALTEAERRRLLCDAVEFLAVLERKQSALEEILSSMTADEERLGRRLRRVVDGRAGIEATLLAKTQRVQSLQDEIAEADACRGRLELRRAGNVRRLEKLSRLAGVLERQIRTCRQARQSGADALRTIHRAVMRMDRKVDAEDHDHPCQAAAAVSSGEDTAER